MFDDTSHTLAWARRVLADHILPAVHSERVPVQVAAWSPEGSVRDAPVRASEAIAAEYRSSPGMPGGRRGAPAGSS
ncbi:MAG: hypothetical protein ACK5MT_16595 [Actinomycetales bacterium]